MALFKVFRGEFSKLPEINDDNIAKGIVKDGFAYFCTDDGSFWIDYLDSDGILQRKRVNQQKLEELGYQISNAIKLNLINTKVGQGIRIAEIDENGSPVSWEAVNLPYVYTLTINVVRTVDSALEALPYNDASPVIVAIIDNDGVQLASKTYKGMPIQFDLIENTKYTITITSTATVDNIVYFNPTVLEDAESGIVTGNKDVYIRFADVATMESLSDVKEFLALGLEPSIYESTLVSDDGSAGFVFDIEITDPANSSTYTMPCRIVEVGEYTKLNADGIEETFYGAKCTFDYALPDSLAWDSCEQVYANEDTFLANADGYYYLTTPKAVATAGAEVVALVEGTDYQVGDSIGEYIATQATAGKEVFVLHHAWDVSNINVINVVRYGSNIYHESNLDKWLNSSDTGWFVPYHLGDRCEDENRIGFLNWFKAEDLALIEDNCKWGVYERTGHELPNNSIYRRFVLASGTEIAGSVNANEGDVWKYWLYKNGNVVGNASNSERTIKKINAKTNTTRAWIRSPYRSCWYGAWCLGATGGVNNGICYDRSAVVPAFII